MSHAQAQVSFHGANVQTDHHSDPYKELPDRVIRAIGQVFAPTQRESLLLRTCLRSGDAVRVGFGRWSKSPVDAIADLQARGGARRRLIPLLHGALERESLTPPREMQALLRAGSLYEELRTRAYREIARDVLDRLTAAQIPFLATRGVYFAASLYGEGELRHCHDIDLLLPEAKLTAAAERLVSDCGFKLVEAESSQKDLQLYHSSGLPLALHSTAAQSPVLELSWDVLWAAKTTGRAYGTEFETLSPEYSLLQALLQGATGPQRHSLLWLCDAYKLTNQPLDWSAFLDAVCGGPQTLIALLSLEYLAAEFKAPVPQPLRDSLWVRWKSLNGREQRQAEEILLLLLQQTEGTRTILRRNGNILDRARLLWTVTFPSSRTLYALGQISSVRDTPRVWARRLGGMIGSVLR